MGRLVFSPYTQVRRTICTSVSLRASTRVSSGFAPLRHSSPSFGSRQVCSHSNPSQKIKVGRRCTRWGIPPISFLAPYGFTRPLTRTHVRLLGPCFKTGRMGGPQADARSAQVPEHAETARAAFQDREDDAPGTRRSATPPIRIGPRLEPIGGPAFDRSTSDRGTSPAPIRFPPDNFKHSLTLFSKSFSSFPRGTCSLSVSRPYLALDGIYRPLRAAFPNNPTRRQRLVERQGPGTTGLSPSLAPLSRGLGPGPPQRTLLQTTIRTTRPPDFKAGLFPVRSPLLGESL